MSSGTGRALVGGLLIVGGVVGACVIAEPPSDPPTPPAVRPTIIRASAVPSPTGVVTGWPARFVIQVQVSDPRKAFYASWFVDYNAGTGDGFGDYELSPPSEGSVRTLSIAVTQPTSDACHTIEIVVAREFRDLAGGTGQGAHTPLDPTTDGDSIVWFYSPNGDPSGCPVIDAGLTPIDAGGDGGDGGPT